MPNASNAEQMKILMRLLNCKTEEDIIPAIHEFVQFKEDSERIFLMMKTFYRLPKNCSLNDLEVLMI